MKHNTDRFVTAIFCDDMRLEIGNKMSFMGCYQGDLFVASAPIVLPKFCVHATVWTPKENRFHALSVRFVLNDIELARVEAPVSDPEVATRIVDESATRVGISVAIAFSPFMIEKPTTLRVLATTEEGEIVGPRLLIKVAKGQEAIATSAKEQKSSVPSPTKRKSAKKTASSVA